MRGAQTGYYVLPDTTRKEITFAAGQYVTLAANSAQYAPGNNDFTVEGWFRFTSTVASVFFWGCSNGSGVVNKLGCYTDASGHVQVDIIGGARITSSSVITTNTTYHIAVERVGTTTTLYINGVAQGTDTATRNISTLTNAWNIGWFGESSINFAGTISQFRYVNGTAVYGGAFTPPRAPLSNVTNTKILVLFNNSLTDTSTLAATVTQQGGAASYASTTIANPSAFGQAGYGIAPGGAAGTIAADANVLMHFNSDVVTDSASGLTWTANNGTLSSAQSKFGGASALFSSAATGIQTPYNAAMDLGLSTSWTVEAWVWLIGNQSSLGARLDVFSKANVSGTRGFDIGITSAGLSTTYPGVVQINSVSMPISSGAWHHVTWCRSGNNYYFGLDGAVNTVANSGVPGASITDSMQIGGDQGGGGAPGITYYLDEVRVVNGRALYTSAYSVPTNAFTPTLNVFGTISDPYYYSNTVLIHGEGANGGAVLTESAKNWALTATGSITTSTAQSKFGSSSLSFPGSNNTGLATPVSQDFTFGAGVDFSIEFWMYPTSAVNTIPLIMTNNNNVTINNNHWYLHYNRTGLAPNAPNALQWFHDAISTTVAQITTPAIIFPNTGWYFVQLTRTGNTYTLYVGGLNCGSYTSATALDDGVTPQAIYFGGQPAGTNVGYAGYLDEIRISKMNRQTATGVSLPTAAFPSTQATDSFFPTVSASYALDTDLLDPSAVGGTLVLNSNNTAALSNAAVKFGTNSLQIATTNGGGAVGTGNGWAQSTNALPAMAGDFTIECWMYPIAARTSPLTQFLFSIDPGTTTNRFAIAWDSGGTQLILFGAAALQTISLNISAYLNVWSHFAIIRTGTTVKIYINGIQVNTNLTFSSTVVSNKLNIGSLGFNGGSPADSRPWLGYIANFRVSNGVVRYPVFPIQTAAAQDVAPS